MLPSGYGIPYSLTRNGQSTEDHNQKKCDCHFERSHSEVTTPDSCGVARNLSRFALAEKYQSLTFREMSPFGRHYNQKEI